MADPLMDRLAALPSAEPDPLRSARTRQRCRAALVRQAPAPATRAQAPRVRPTIWSPAVAVLGGLYLVQALVIAFRFYATR